MTVPQAEHVSVHLDPSDVMTAYAQHRRRFASEVASLDASVLAAPSRCTEWSVADVLRHLIDVEVWMDALWSGNPPPFTSFDPNTTPHEFVVAARSTPDDAIRDRYVATAEKMSSYVEAAGPDLFGQPSISPLGFVPWWLSVLHIFWDSWLHERDIFLANGIQIPEEPAEIVPVFAYALALAGRLLGEELDTTISGMQLTTGSAGTSPAILQGGTVSVTPVDPELDVAPMIDAMAGRGDAEVPPQLLGLAKLFANA